MNRTRNILIALIALGTIACGRQTAEPIVEATMPPITDSTLSPEVLWAFGRLGEIAVSPDYKRVAYTVSYYSVEQNRGNSELYVMDCDGNNKRRLTHTAGFEFNPVWTDGNTLFYISTQGGSAQLWKLNLNIATPEKISGFEQDINGFALSPNGDKIILISDVKVGKSVAEIYPDLPQTTGKIYDDLMYRHWDTWEDSLFNHIFVADFDGNAIQNAVDIMEGEPWDTPLKPFGGMEEIVWSPKGDKIAYTCKKLVGKEAAFSTNSDIYLYDLKTKTTENLTEGMNGYDRQPLFSPDGSSLLWLSMERAGFEADKDRLFLMDLSSRQKRYLTRNFDYSPSNVIWDKSGKNLFFIAGVEATYQVFRLNPETGEVKPVTSGWHDYHSIALAGANTLIGSKVSIVKPTEIYSIDLQTGKEQELSFINRDLLSKLKMPTVKQRWITSTDGKKVHTWVILPPGFDSTRTYPALLYCEGGPQSAVSQFWSYRWNFSIMASNGYVVVAPSRRGTLTFGQDWTDQISKDHGGQEMKDLLCAIDQLKTEPWIDQNRLGAIGASYGGYTVFWLAGHHNKRFKAFIAHCGVFNSEMEYMTTEEMFFDSWEMGGAPWETDNPVAMRSFANSPHKFVTRWDTPIMIIHGGHDFRIPYTQGMAAFNTARMLGIPSRFLFFPDENHWVLKPQNGILWQREFKSWLDRWLKK